MQHILLMISCYIMVVISVLSYGSDADESSTVSNYDDNNKYILNKLNDIENKYDKLANQVGKIQRKQYKAWSSSSSYSSSSSPSSCRKDTQCPIEWSCRGGKCRKTNYCTDDYDCGPLRYCFLNQCVPRCDMGYTCPAGLGYACWYINGRCANKPNCTEDFHCPYWEPTDGLWCYYINIVYPGVCLPKCEYHDDCKVLDTDMICLDNGHCDYRDPPFSPSSGWKPACKNDIDCGYGYKCDHDGGKCESDIDHECDKNKKCEYGYKCKNYKCVQLNAKS